MAEWWEQEFNALEGEYFTEPDEIPLNDLLFGGELDVDMHAQELFREAMFEGNESAYEDLIDYMWDVYGIDFEDAFSWEDFREWYG